MQWLADEPIRDDIRGGPDRQLIRRGGPLFIYGTPVEPVISLWAPRELSFDVGVYYDYAERQPFTRWALRRAVHSSTTCVPAGMPPGRSMM